MRRRRIATVAIVVAAAVVTTGALWSRATNRAAADRSEHRDRVVTARLARATEELAAATAHASATFRQVAGITEARDALARLAAALSAERDRVRSERDRTALAALASGARAGAVRDCLHGVQQALNQLAVGDRGGIGSLARVGDRCREAAA